MIALIARREIVVRLQQKGFRIGFAISLVAIAVVCALPKLLSGSGSTSYDIGLVGSIPDGMQTVLDANARARAVKIKIHSEAVADARAKVSAGAWDAALVDDHEIVAKSADSGAASLLQAARQQAEVLGRLRRSGLSAEQAQAALTAAPLPVVTTQSGQSTQRQAIATIAVIVLFGQLISYCTWVANGVVEEKSSRVVELLLSAVRPVQLLAGKLLGIGALAVAQVALLGVTALASARLSRSLTLGAPAYEGVLAAFLGFVFGFAFFASVAAALASTVSRQEELGGILAPMTILLMLAYLGSLAAASSPDTTFARVLSIVPPFSAFGMPARVARGGVTVDLVLAVVLMLIAIAAVLLLAGRIYRAAILHTGSRLPLRAAWRGEAIGELD